MLQVYSDESKPDKEVPFYTVAGYVFTDVQARKFNKEWQAFLDKKGLPYFRMSERQSLGKKYNIDSSEMDRVVRQLIDTVKRRTLLGIGITIHKSAYDAFLARRAVSGDPDGLRMPSAYPFGCYCILQELRHWLNQTGREDSVAFFFEAGEENERDARAWLDALFTQLSIKAKHRHAGHKFVPKLGHPALQGGDMLAWHTAKLHKCELEGRPVRKDFIELIRPQDRRVDYTPLELALTSVTLENAGLIPRAD